MPNVLQRFRSEDRIPGFFRKGHVLQADRSLFKVDREFRVDSVKFEQGTVSLQYMTLAKEARDPIFRTEPLEYIGIYMNRQICRWKKR